MTTLLAHLNRGLPTASVLAGAVRGGELSAVAVIDAARAMAAEASAAFISMDWEGARVRAAHIDRQPLPSRGLLAGVPVSVKDVVAVAGLPATAGSQAFADNVPTWTAPAVQRLLDAGAIVIGKTNCPEFGFGITCESPVRGLTPNPRWPDRTVGGSSGGEAAALALGASALGIGTDFGGSVRWPAQCAGLTALRPSIGTVPIAGQLPGIGGDLGGFGSAGPRGAQGALQTIGPLARSVGDLALAFAVMSRRQLVQVPVIPGRVIWTAGDDLGPVRLEIAELMARLASRLAGLGHAVREVPGMFAECLSAYDRWRALDPLLDHAAATADVTERIGAASLRMIADSLGADQAELAAAAEAARRARRAAAELLAGVDVALLPVAGGPACDPSGSLDVDGVDVAGWSLMGHCRAVSLTGAPAVSVPVGLSAEGWPLSVQVVTAPGRDEAALAWAQVVEAACDPLPAIGEHG